MSDGGDPRAQVHALVGQEPSLSNDQPAVVGWLQRLCRAAARALDATGVGVSLLSEPGARFMAAAASDRSSAILEELQFEVGEGPCLTAFDTRGPVLVPDLAFDGARWPGYTAAAMDHGVRAVFAFPLQMGVARLGALDVYRHRAGELSADRLSTALSFADVARDALLDSFGDLASWEALAADHVDGQFEVYQAQGMVMVQLGVSAEVALARLRALAFTLDRRLVDVASDVLARKLVLDMDDPG